MSVGVLSYCYNEKVNYDDIIVPLLLVLEKDNYIKVDTIDKKIISLKNYFGNYDKLKKDLKEYHAFFAIGGNTFALRKAMQLSGFDTFLKEISNKENYLYGGYSAGICVLSPDLHGLHLVDEPINPYNEEEVLYRGIGLLDYVPVPHYKSDHPESKMVDDVVEYCEKNNIKFRTLKDGDVIVQEIGEM